MLTYKLVKFVTNLLQICWLCL